MPKGYIKQSSNSSVPSSVLKELFTKILLLFGFSNSVLYENIAPDNEPRLLVKLELLIVIFIEYEFQIYEYSSKLITPLLHSLVEQLFFRKLDYVIEILVIL